VAQAHAQCSAPLPAVSRPRPGRDDRAWPRRRCRAYRRLRRRRLLVQPYRRPATGLINGRRQAMPTLCKARGPTARLLRAAIALAALAAVQSAAAGQDYPARPVRIVVPFAPGASTDMLARLAADELGKRLGQSFVVENVGGAGGSIGTNQVVRAEPDGYTLVAATPGPITIAPAMGRDIPYD